MTDQESVDWTALDEAAVEALLRGDGPTGDPLTGVLLAVRGERARPVPEPSAELAVLLAEGLAAPRGRGRRRVRVLGGVLVAGATTFAVSGVAAAHDALPDPVQRVITDIVNTTTPWHIGPADPDRRLPQPTDVPKHGPSTVPGPGQSDDRRGRDKRSSGSGRDDAKSGSGDTGRDGGGSSDSGRDGSGSGSRDGGRDSSGDGSTSGSGGDSGSTSGGGSGSGSGGSGSGDGSTGSSSGGSSGSGSGSDGGSGSGSGSGSGDGGSGSGSGSGSGDGGSGSGGGGSGGGAGSGGGSDGGGSGGGSD
jgi:hypothetical protein